MKGWPFSFLLPCLLWAQVATSTPNDPPLPDPEMSYTLLPTIYAFNHICPNAGQTGPMSTLALAHQIGPVCEAVLASPLCQAVEEEDRLECSGIEGSSQVNAWSLIKGCGAGGLSWAKDMLDLSWDVMKWVWGQATDRRRRAETREYIDMAMNYLHTEYERALEEAPRWMPSFAKKAHAMAAVADSIGTLILSRLSNLISRESLEFGCLNFQAKSEKLCYALGHIFSVGLTGGTATVGTALKGTKLMLAIVKGSVKTVGAIPGSTARAVVRGSRRAIRRFRQQQASSSTSQAVQRERPSTPSEGNSPGARPQQQAGPPRPPDDVVRTTMMPDGTEFTFREKTIGPNNTVLIERVERVDGPSISGESPQINTQPHITDVTPEGTHAPITRIDRLLPSRESPPVARPRQQASPSTSPAVRRDRPSTPNEGNSPVVVRSREQAYSHPSQDVIWTERVDGTEVTYQRTRMGNGNNAPVVIRELKKGDNPPTGEGSPTLALTPVRRRPLTGEGSRPPADVTPVRISLPRRLLGVGQRASIRSAHGLAHANVYILGFNRNNDRVLVQTTSPNGGTARRWVHWRDLSLPPLPPPPPLFRFR